LWERNDENTITNFSFADLMKMADMPPTEHLANADQSPLVAAVQVRMGVGKASAIDIVAHLIRLSQSNPVIIWDNQRKMWVGIKHGLGETWSA
jgi:hypothetical protein